MSRSGDFRDDDWLTVRQTDRQTNRLLYPCACARGNKESCLKVLSSVDEVILDEDLVLSLFKAQCSLLPCCGECGVDCSDKGWCAETNEEIQMQPGESVYIWQYVHCVGERNILYHQQTTITNSCDVPPIPKTGTNLIIYHNIILASGKLSREKTFTNW